MMGEESRAFPGYVMGEHEFETDEVFYSVVSCPRGYPLWFEGYIHSHGLVGDIVVELYAFLLEFFAHRLPIKVGIVATNLKGGTWLFCRTIHKEVHLANTDVEPRMNELIESVARGDFEHLWPKRKV